MMINNYLKNWYPVKLFLEENELKCRWKNFADIQFIDPFFDSTILKASSVATNSSIYKSTSDLQILLDWADTFDSIEPTAFIFHISRCGSTLLTQSLCLNEEYIVLSEVPFIDNMLRLLTIDDWLVDVEYQNLLKAAIKIYGQKRKRTESKLFIKTDSWHLYYYPLLRLLYPDTPFIGLYRKPTEVLRSQQKKKGMHAVPGLIPNRILGLATKDTETTDWNEHMTRVLESYIFSFIKISHVDELFFMFNYNEGIDYIVNKMASILDIELNENYQKQLRQRLTYDAKYPEEIFKADLTPKSDTPRLRSLNALYYELERIRNLQLVRPD